MKNIKRTHPQEEHMVFFKVASRRRRGSYQAAIHQISNILPTGYCFIEVYYKEH